VLNAEYVWTMTADAFKATDARQASLWYPGDLYVDDIGADAYNWYNCRTGINSPWTSLASLLEPVRIFGQQHPAKGLMVPEWGTVEDSNSPNRKAQWFQDAEGLFQGTQWSQFTSVLYFHSRHPTSEYPNCLW
jgi:hypothetical protein